MKNAVIVTVLLALASCSGEGVREKIKNTMAKMEDTDKTREVKVGQYALQLPEFLKPSPNLNDEASLQYANIYKEFYVVVIDETKTSVDTAFGDAYLLPEDEETASFEVFSDYMIGTYDQKFDSIVDKRVIDFTVNGKKAKQLTFTASFNGYQIFYNMNFIEGEKHFYQIFTWCLLKDKEKNVPVMDKMVRSFHEV